MSNEAERVAFKAKFRPRHDVREILERNSFTNAITEQMWRGFQAGAAYQRTQEQPADALDEAIQDVLDHLNGGYSIHSGTGLHSILRDTYRAELERPKSAPVVVPAEAAYRAAMESK